MIRKLLPFACLLAWGFLVLSEAAFACGTCGTSSAVSQTSYMMPYSAAFAPAYTTAYTAPIPTPAIMAASAPTTIAYNSYRTAYVPYSVNYSPYSVGYATPPAYVPYRTAYAPATGEPIGRWGLFNHRIIPYTTNRPMVMPAPVVTGYTPVVTGYAPVVTSYAPVAPVPSPCMNPCLSSAPVLPSVPVAPACCGSEPAPVASTTFVESSQGAQTNYVSPAPDVCTPAPGLVPDSTPVTTPPYTNSPNNNSPYTNPPYTNPQGTNQSLLNPPTTNPGTFSQDTPTSAKKETESSAYERSEKPVMKEPEKSSELPLTPIPEIKTNSYDKPMLIDPDNRTARRSTSTVQVGYSSLDVPPPITLSKDTWYGSQSR